MPKLHHQIVAGAFGSERIGAVNCDEDGEKRASTGKNIFCD
jgi:hypothetical protein